MASPGFRMHSSFQDQRSAYLAAGSRDLVEQEEGVQEGKLVEEERNPQQGAALSGILEPLHKPIIAPTDTR